MTVTGNMTTVEVVWGTTGKGAYKKYLNGKLIQTTEVERPPSEAYYFTWEQCDVVIRLGREAGECYWKRVVKSTPMVFTGSRNQDRKEWFLKLNASVCDLSPAYGAAAEWIIPKGPYVSLVEGVQRDVLDIRVGGKQLDCNGIAFQQLKKQAHLEKEVTVKPLEKGSKSKWYEYTLTPAWPPLYAMTRSVYPGASDVRIQDKFDEGALRLGIDDDKKLFIGNDRDDVPYYADFYIINDKKPAPWPDGYKDPQYNNIVGETVARSVSGFPFAHIKQVTSIDIDGPCGGYAIISSFTVPQIVLASNTTSIAVHEWGHTRSLADERDPARWSDAIMYWRETAALADEINRGEADLLFQYEGERPPEPK